MARRLIDRSQKNILLEGVDRDLFDRALAKAQALPPPGNKLKWVIVDLIRQWVDGPPPRVARRRVDAVGTDGGKATVETEAP